MTALRVSLKAAVPAPHKPAPLLDERGPLVILGDHDPFTGALAPSRTSLYGPRGAALLAPDGPLWIADSGHHRVVGYEKLPTQDGAPADWVLGQPDFESEHRAPAAPLTMDLPTGVGAFGESGLYVCDSWHNRVLIWREAPRASGVPPDFVLGQSDFTGQETNRGLSHPRADTMHWPFQALMHEGRFFVADAGNRRVLGWSHLPERPGQPADIVLGQPSLEERSDNGGGPADARTMRWPHDLAIVRGDLAVADAGNNRVLVFDGVPTESHVPAARVLGQADFVSVDHNRGEYLPTEFSLSMPYGLCAMGDALWVADTSNSRLVRFSLPGNSESADRLTGQDAFTLKGDNRWRMAERDSLCWPYGLRALGGLAIVSDTGNHRVLLWPEARHG